MYNFKPGGASHRKSDLGGRPRSDADYSTKGRFDKKPRHDARGGGRDDRGGDRGAREMQLFPATCTTCGKSCEVPFRPDGTKPVLCRDCFATKNASPERLFGRDDRNDRRPDTHSERTYDAPRASAAPSVDIAPLTRQVSALEAKISQLVDMVGSLERKLTIVEKKEAKPEVVKAAAPAPKAKKVEVAKAAPALKAKKEVVAKAPAKPVAKKAVVKAVAKVAMKATKKVAKK